MLGLLNHYELDHAVKAAMADAGMIISRPLNMNGMLQREHIEGHKSGSKNAAYIVHAEQPQNAWFMDYKTGISGKLNLSGKREPMTKAMRLQIKDERQRRKIEQQERHSVAADKAQYIQSKAIPIIDQSEHTYLINKKIQPHTARLYGDALVIPIYDENRQIVNLQFIAADGTKRFLSGGRKKACFSVIGKLNADSPILIAEGYSTGASIHESTGFFTVVALDCGNLKPVALVMRKLYPNKEIVLMGDNDVSGVGQKAARSASLAVGGKYLIPPTAGLDWNDVIVAGGSHYEAL